MREDIRLKLLAVVILSLIFMNSAIAASIVFKNGKLVEAKILEKTTEYIKVDIKGIP